MDIKQPQYFTIYQIAWNFHKQHSKIRNDEAFWEGVVADYKDICKENRDKPGFELLRDLLLAALSELERIGGCYGKYAKMGKTDK